MEHSQLIPESIARVRNRVALTRRKMVTNAVCGDQMPTQSLRLSEEIAVVTPKERPQVTITCDFCGTPNIPVNMMTPLESGQLLCPTCIEDFRNA